MALEGRVRIVSDGTGPNTYIYDRTGQLLDVPIAKLTWTMDARSRLGTATITMELVELEATGDLADSLANMSGVHQHTTDMHLFEDDEWSTQDAVDEILAAARGDRTSVIYAPAHMTVEAD